MDRGVVGSRSFFLFFCYFSLVETMCTVIYSCSVTNVHYRTRAEVITVAERHELLMELLRDVNKRIFELVHQASGSPGLGVARMMIMGQLAEHPGSTISELARAIGLAKSHVSTTVEHLARRGWIEKRTDDHDLRLVRIFPTKRSAEQLEVIDVAVRQRINSALSALPEQQVDNMLLGLQALRAILTGNDDKVAEPDHQAAGSEGGAKL